MRVGKRTRNLAIAVIIVGVAVCGLTQGIPERGEGGAVATLPPPTRTRRPTKTPRATPTATSTPTVEESIAQTLTQALGRSNRGVERVSAIELDGASLRVDWTINDNLTDALILDGALADVVTIGGALSLNGIEELMLVGTFPLTDAYGRTTSEAVIAVTFYAETMAKIHWSGMLLDNVLVVADEAWLHDVFLGLTLTR